MLDKYGVGQDPYCYPGTVVLRNRLGLTDDSALHEAERSLSEIAASQLDFDLPPYDLAYLGVYTGICSATFTIGRVNCARSISRRVERISAT